MKRILCLTLMLALVLSAVLAPTAALAASSYTVRTTASVNLRKGPGLGYGKITSLKSGKTLSYAGVSQFDSRGMGWHKVYYNGSAAWISWAYSNLVQGDHLGGHRLGFRRLFAPGGHAGRQAGEQFGQFVRLLFQLHQGLRLRRLGVAAHRPGPGLQERDHCARGPEPQLPRFQFCGRSRRALVQRHLQRAERVDLLALRQTVLTVNFTNIPCVRGPRRV